MSSLGNKKQLAEIIITLNRKTAFFIFLTPIQISSLIVEKSRVGGRGTRDPR